MARNKTLGGLLDAFRAECRLSSNPAHNNQVREQQINLLRRTQERLWDDFDWPHLRVERFIDVQAGQRYYDTPDDVAIDRIEKLEVRYGDEWLPLTPGVEALQYAMWDSDIDERSWPVERWDIYEGEQVELWPVPSLTRTAPALEGRIRVTGIRNLRPLVADSDRADLDDRLIVLYAAGEHLAADGARDAQLKLQQAQQRYSALKGNLTPVRRFRMYGATRPENRPLRGPPRVHYRTQGDQ